MLNIDKLKNVISSDGLSEAIQVANLQDLLMSIDKDNINKVASSITNSIFLKDINLVKKLARNIYISCKYRLFCIDNYVKLVFKICNDPTISKDIIDHFKESLFTIKQACCSRPWKLFFIYKCLPYFKDDIYRLLNAFYLAYESSNETFLSSFCFFAPVAEIANKRGYENVLNCMMEKRKNKKLSRIYHIFADNFELLKKNNWELLDVVINESFLSDTIFNAIFHDDFDKFLEFTKQDDFSPNMKVPETIYLKNNLLLHRCTILQFAAFHGANNCFGYLLDHGADPSIKDDIGLNLMQFAVAGGHHRMIAKSQTLGFSFHSAVSLAAEYFRFDLFKWLYQNNSFDLNECFLQTGTILHRCASANNIWLILFCFENDVDVNIFDCLELTPLFYAAKNGSIDAINLFLSHKNVKWDLSDKFKDTPLHGAATYGDVDSFRALMKHKDADINVLDFIGRSILSYAVYYGYSDIVYEIVNYPGAKLNIVDKYGEIPAFNSCMGGDGSTLKALLAKPECDINRPRNDGETLLTIASKGNYISIVQVLMESEYTDPNVTLPDGSKPIHIAAYLGYDEIVSLLLANSRTDVNSFNGYGYTALHLAIKNFHLNVVKTLLQSKRVDINKHSTVLFFYLLRCFIFYLIYLLMIMLYNLVIQKLQIYLIR